MICHIHGECMCVHVHAKVALHMCGDHRTNCRRKFFLPPWVPEIELRLSGLCFKGIDPRVFGWSWSEVFLNNWDVIFSTHHTNHYFPLLAEVRQWSWVYPKLWNQNSLPSPSLDWLKVSTTSKVSVSNDENSRGTLTPWDNLCKHIYFLMPEKCALVSHIVIFLISWLSHEQRNKNEYQHISLCVILTELRASVFHWGIQSC